MSKGDELLKRIQKEAPIPKWRFQLKNGLIWLAFFMFVLVGAAAFSIILFSIQQTDFNVLKHVSHSRLEMVLGILPLFWLVLLTLFLVMAMVSMTKSKRGYKYTITQLLIFSFSFSVLLGTMFFVSGGARKLEHAFEIRVSAYESINEKKKLIWMNPEDGYLSGEIISHEKGKMVLKDFNGKQWQVTYGDIFIPPILDMTPGEKLKMIGKVTAKQVFVAEEIRPWGGMEMMKKRRGEMRRRRSFPKKTTK